VSRLLFAALASLGGVNDLQRDIGLQSTRSTCSSRRSSWVPGFARSPRTFVSISS